MTINKLERFIMNNKYKLLYSDPENGLFSTEFFLLNAPEKMRQQSKETFNILDTLCKKIDVVGAVYSQYDCKFKATENREHISTGYFMHFGAILILASHFYSDLKFLNTAYKILDHFSEVNDSKHLLHNIAEEVLDTFFKSESGSE